MTKKRFDPKNPDLLHARGMTSRRASSKGLVIFFVVSAAVVALVFVLLG